MFLQRCIPTHNDRLELPTNDSLTKTKRQGKGNEATSHKLPKLPLLVILKLVELPTCLFRPHLLLPSRTAGVRVRNGLFERFDLGLDLPLATKSNINTQYL